MARSRSALVPVVSVVPKATGPRDAKGGFAHARCPVWSLPLPPALLPSSQQPGHCLRPPPQSLAAVVAARGAQVWCTESPWPSRLWALVLNIKQLQKPPTGAGDPQVLSSGRGSQVGTDGPPTCHAPLVQGSALPAPGHLGPFGGLGSLFCVHFLGEPGGGLIPWALPSSLPGPVLLTLPSALALLLLTLEAVFLAA